MALGLESPTLVADSVGDAFPPSAGHASLARAIEGLFPAAVSVAIANDDAYDAALWPEETSAMRYARAKRRREFAAGRACARAALVALGEAPAALPRSEHGNPRWPPAVVGSITHCDGFCGAVAVRRSSLSSVGFDVETSQALPRELCDLIVGQEELAALGRLATADAVDGLKIAFSAKEAFYKCYFPVTGHFLAFTDVRIALEPQDETSGCFEVTVLHPSAPGLCGGRGAWFTRAGHVYAGYAAVTP